jgi:transposase
MEVDDFVEETPKPKKTYKQQWNAYNMAQTNEFKLFQDVLIELIDSLIQVRKPLWKNGRPFSDLKDMLFCCVTKCYYGKSARRNIGYLTLSKGNGYIKKVPHFNTILNYYKNPSITNLLKHLIEQSGIPLKEMEQSFATDASGFSTSLYSRWFNARMGKDRDRRLYKKAHVTSGTKSGIVTAIAITEGYYHDSPQFEGLVKTTAKNFDIKEMSADAGYMARHNFDIVSSVGAIPYIMFRSNASNRARGSLVYKRMYQMFKQHRGRFLDRYHLRSNAESVFSTIKRKFGTHLHSKSEIGMTNELLCIILAHNICVLIQELFESNTILNFEDCQKVRVMGGYCAN